MKGALVIPSSLHGLKVTAIGDKAFMDVFGLVKLTSLVIPDTITSIGTKPFRGRKPEHGFV